MLENGRRYQKLMVMKMENRIILEEEDRRKWMENTVNEISGIRRREREG